jgi:tetratricopeptide (TPR) repeat protein
MSTLSLKPVDYQDADHWRWLLTDHNGAFLAEHKVALNPADPEYQGFVDLPGFLQERAIPDRRLVSEAELVDRVGAWIGRQVLGEQVGRAMVEASPVVVRLLLPPEGDLLIHRPLELAQVNGLPLALHDVSLVFEVEGETLGIAKRPVGERLRMLAVFSLPAGETALDLRRERRGLTRLVRRIGRRGRALEWNVLQYAVTRESLQQVLEEGGGWDLIHFSGPGLADGLMLERSDGSADLVSTPELVRLLRSARGRLKLVTLTSSQSEERAAAQAPGLSSLARELVRRLDCAVVAMRYPVGEEFAVRFAEAFYDNLLHRGQSLPRAMQLALGDAVGPYPTPGAPAQSVAAPTLLGPLAADLHLYPPPGPPIADVRSAKMAHFPDEPERFFGRAGPMARASAALAPRSRHTGVLFLGMTGIGTTACALELAYRHQQAFHALAWWTAPEEGRDASTTLQDFARALEAQLPGLAMVHAVGSEAELGRFLPRFTQLLEDRLVLLVLDNLGTLLTERGEWRDPRWRLLIESMASHLGESRLVLTSRVPPARLDGRVLVEPIHALSRDEALLLARELPNLGRLLSQDVATTAGREPPPGPALVHRVLGVVQGHPKLLELADAEATDPQRLLARLAEADQALPRRAGRLQAFFADGESALAPEHFIEVLGSWTRGAAATLPEGARLLFWFLCALEEADRWQPIIQANWADLWRRLGRDGEPPPLDEAVAPLVAQALVQVEQVEQAEQEGEDAPVRYRLHPAVAEAGRQEAGEQFQAAVDAELAAYWYTGLGQATQAEGGEASGLVVRAGRAATPYLLRLGDWATASRLLEQVLRRDSSPTTVAALLPLLNQIAQATGGTDQELTAAAVLARVMGLVDPVEGERQLRAVLADAVAQQRYDLASVTAGDLMNLLGRTGRLREALTLVDDMEGYTRQAGLGPWTQLGDRGRRLQLLLLLGEYERVLAEVQQLRDQMASLPEASDQDERVAPWSVREGILEIGALAARELDRFEVALELNGEVTRSKAARDAPALNQARTRFNDYSPLLRLGRWEDARALLHYCQAVFQAERDVAGLGRVFSALADLEDKLGHPQDAIALEQAALRYLYIASDPDNVAVSHFNLANYLRRAEGDPALVVAHRLAAALLDFQTGSSRLATILRRVAGDLGGFGNQVLPGSFEELVGLVGQVEGVRFGELLTGVPGPADSGDAALAEVLRQAREQPADAEQGVLDQWAPLIDVAAAAAGGDAEATAALEPLLVEMDETGDWAALAGVLRRVLSGERGEQLLVGLDQVDTAIMTVLLGRLDDQSRIPSGQ